MNKPILTVALSALALASCGSNSDQAGAAGGQQIQIVGSSTVYPFTTAVAERFAQANPSFKAPIVESTGTGAGMKLFCGGVGDNSRHRPTRRAGSRSPNSKCARPTASAR